MKNRQKFISILLSVFFIASFSLLAETQDKPEQKPEPAFPKKIIPLGNITVMGSYSKVMGGNNLSGLYVSAYFVPLIRLTPPAQPTAERTGPQDYLIPLYNGLYKKQRQIINEEEGGRLYTTLMNHNFSLMHKRLYPDLFTQRVSGFVTINYNKETSDESFGDGLYDYRDYGVSLDYQYSLIKTENNLGTILLGGKYYFRKYPNYKTLISLAEQTAPEEDEKDQHVWGPTIRYTHKFAAQSTLSLSYDFLLKRFTDKHTIDLNGILEDKKRQDNVHFFKLKGDHRLKKNLILSLDGEIELNNSNQNYYDTLETPTALGDDVFVPHYFNYNRYAIRPSLTYLFPLAEKKNIVFKVAYGYTVRDYSNRNVKDSAGNYKSELQQDRIHASFLNINFPITEKLSFLFNADYIHNISNMEYERYYRYDYDIYHILSGFSYKF